MTNPLPGNYKPVYRPAPDLRGKERDRNGKLVKSVRVTYPVSYCYNGGTSLGLDDWYTGYEVPPPILPDGYRLRNLGIGLQLNARPPYATMLLVQLTGELNSPTKKRGGRRENRSSKA